ncbi:N-acylneuraminate-9-phosphatase [Nematostella vectensis]|uniref:N-acylneuraminate-9-phosphatase n=1 Tax=Nematostella vectensis TaxID=45351 RepID=UPI0020777DAA|nr:N-acylneuraminate-9-phosphatase [Nematostella vectensis]
MAVKGLLFDFDNTLVQTNKSDLEALEKVKQWLMETLSEEQALAATSEFSRLLHEHWVDPDGTKSVHEWRTSLWLKAINILPENITNITAGELYSFWRESRVKGLGIPTGVQFLLEDLGHQYKMAIITNSDPVIQKEKLEFCKVEKYFDAIIISGEQPEAKPCVSIFQTACDAIGLAPEDCVMIGDNLVDDIQGGRDAGVRATVWVWFSCAESGTSQWVFSHMTGSPVEP